jgi:translation initiation factor 1
LKRLVLCKRFQALIEGLPVSKNTRLVYSTDPKDNIICPTCKNLKIDCGCSDLPKASEYKFVAVLRLEKKGRGGKAVTVIDQLPKQEIFLRELSAVLKKKCGVGGTYITSGKEGVVEIQGDKREMIRVILIERGIKTKG